MEWYERGTRGERGRGGREESGIEGDERRAGKRGTRGERGRGGREERGVEGTRRGWAYVYPLCMQGAYARRAALDGDQGRRWVRVRGGSLSAAPRDRAGPGQVQCPLERGPEPGRVSVKSTFKPSGAGGSVHQEQVKCRIGWCPSLPHNPPPPPPLPPSLAPVLEAVSGMLLVYSAVTAPMQAAYPPPAHRHAPTRASARARCAAAGAGCQRRSETTRIRWRAGG